MAASAAAAPGSAERQARGGAASAIGNAVLPSPLAIVFGWNLPCVWCPVPCSGCWPAGWLFGAGIFGFWLAG